MRTDNKKNRKDDRFPMLISGLMLIILGFAGLGYIPGKSDTLTIVFALMMVSGITITLFFRRKNKTVSRKMHSVRTPSFRYSKAVYTGRPVRNNSQFAA